MVRGLTGSATPGGSIPGCSPAARRSISCSISMMAGLSGYLPPASNASTSTRHCSGRPSLSPIRRRGLDPWVRLPIRSWRDLRRRQVDHALQDVADHGEMIAVAAILPLEVGEMGFGDI